MLSTITICYWLYCLKGDFRCIISQGALYEKFNAEELFMKLLIVDDSLLMRKAIERSLADTNFTLGVRLRR
jgi:hypothetical protein